MSIVSLLAQTEYLPTRVRFLLTSRNELKVLDQFRQVRRLNLFDQQYLGRADADIRIYIEQRMSEANIKAHVVVVGSSETIQERLVEKAARNFLYIQFLLDEVAASKRSLENLTGLPSDLFGLYRAYLDRLMPEMLQVSASQRWAEQFQPLLGCLSVSVSAVPQEVLPHWLGRPEGEVEALLNDLTQIVENDRDGYRLYHHSLAEFLITKSYGENGTYRRNRYYTPPREQHERIAGYYLDNFQNHWQDCDFYGLRYLPIHMIKAERKEELCRLLTGSPDWMQSKSKLFDDYTTYAEDLELALQDFYDSSTLPKLLALSQLHTARQVIRRQVSFYTNNDLRTLVWLGRETEAAGHARLRPDPRNRFWGLLAVYDALLRKDQRRTVLLDQAWEATDDIEDEDERLVALVDLAIVCIQIEHEIHITAILDQITRTAYAIRGDWWSGLIRLGTSFANIGRNQEANELFTELWQIPQVKRPLIDIPDALALAMLSEAQAQTGRFSEANTTAHVIQDDWHRTKALITLAVYLVRANQQDVANNIFEEVNESIGSAQGQWRIDALIMLGSALVQVEREKEARSIFDEAGKFARSIEAERDRAQALAGLAVASSEAEYEEEADTVFSEAVQVANAIPDDFSEAFPGGSPDTLRTSTLHSLVQALLKRNHFAEAMTVVGTIKNKWIQPEALYECISVLAWNENFLEARQIAQTIENDEYRAKALCTLSMALTRSKRFTEAGETIRDIGNAWIKADALSYLAASLAYSEKKFEAEVIHNEVEELKPNLYIAEKRSWALLWIAKVLYHAGYRGEAVAVLERVQVTFDLIDNRGKRDEVLSELSLILVDMNHFKEAERIVYAIQDPIDRSAALQKLATALAQAGHGVEANNRFREAKSMIIGSSGHPVDKSRALGRLAVAASRADCEDAQKILSDARLAAQAAQQFLTLGALASIEWVLTLIKIKAFSEALKAARKCAYKAEALIEVAAALAKAGRREEAWAVFEEAKEIARSSWPNELIRLAETLSQVGFKEESWDTFEEAEAVVHSSVRSAQTTDHLEQSKNLIRLATALYRAGHKERATSVFVEAEQWTYAISENSANRAEILSYLARALAEAGYFTEAKKAAYSIESREPNWPRSNTLWKLALQFAKDQQFAEAFDLLDVLDIDDFLKVLAEWSLALEQTEPGVPLEVLCQAIRIAGWMHPDWQHIYETICDRLKS